MNFLVDANPDVFCLMFGPWWNGLVADNGDPNDVKGPVENGRSGR